jgi:hypothetical protein
VVGGYEMPCYHPLTAYRTSAGEIVFHDRGDGDQILLPCGRCIGCRLERSRQWAIRCMHEAQLYDENCFVTLTYDDEHLPENGSLHYPHFQRFMKRLRKRFTGRKIRFYMCGEYGDTTFRPHYHSCLFNFTFPDLTYLKKTGSGSKIYTSEILSELWLYGMSSVGSVTYESAGYIARYCLKKVNGDEGRSRYQVVDSESGEITFLDSPFSHMSLRPGIASVFFRRFGDDCRSLGGFVIVDGKRLKMPRYYEKLLRSESPLDYQEMKTFREYIS